MPVTNIECQLVKAQINRYLRGEELGTEVMRQLEAHLLACDDCKEVLVARKSELRSRLATSSDKASGLKAAASKLRAAVSMPATEVASPRPPATQPHTPVSQAAQAAAALKPNLKPSLFAKPAAYTVVLAAVLVLMTQMTKGGGFFGPRAVDTFSTPAANSMSATVQTTVPNSVVTPNSKANVILPTATQTNPLVAPAVANSSLAKSPKVTPKPGPSITPLHQAPANQTPVTKPNDKPVTTRTAQIEQPKVPFKLTPTGTMTKWSAGRRSFRRLHRKHSLSKIRVYDAQGKPIQP